MEENTVIETTEQEAKTCCGHGKKCKKNKCSKKKCIFTMVLIAAVVALVVYLVI